MLTNQVVIVTNPLERRVVVAVDKYHGSIDENIVTELSEDEIGLRSLQGPHGNEGPIVFGQFREHHGVLEATNANRTVKIGHRHLVHGKPIVICRIISIEGAAIVRFIAGFGLTARTIGDETGVAQKVVFTSGSGRKRRGFWSFWRRCAICK